jgi:hypothetical protein
VDIGVWNGEQQARAGRQNSERRICCYATFMLPAFLPSLFRVDAARWRGDVAAWLVAAFYDRSGVPSAWFLYCHTGLLL